MTRVLPCLATVAFLAAPPALAATDGVPHLNVEPTCRAIPDPALSTSRDTASCMKSENEARDKLATEWASYPAADRALCTQTATMGGTASYVELLTCLEMRRDARTLPRDGLTRIGTQP